MTKRLLFILIIGAALSLQSFSQQPVTNRQEQERESERLRIEADRNRINAQSNQHSRDFEESVRQGRISDLRRRNYPNKPLSQKELKEVRKNLDPAPEDSAAYKSFLKQSKGGLFRLMPNFNCTEQLIVTAKQGCEKSYYMGEYYSFAFKNYADKPLYDLTYKDGNLTSDSFWTQAILTSLGDVPLESLTSASSGLQYISSFIPQTENKAVKKQFAEISGGIDADGYRYSKSAKAILNNTYALRLIRYRLDENDLFFRFRHNDLTSTDQKIMLTARISDTDLTLVFRIIRQDTDGSLSILWKEVEKKKSPKITFLKNEPLSDIKIS